MSQSDLPPAIVLGVDSQIGLTVVRELGERGVPVYGVAASKRGVGLYSRWLRGGYIRPAEPAQTTELLNRIAAETGARFLLTISEADALYAALARETGQFETLKPLVPTVAKMALVTDKLKVCELAKEVGISVPETWEPDAANEIDSAPAALTFPCVLKWRDPNQVLGALKQHGLPFVKSEYCYSREELARALHRYDAIGRYPMVQSFCPGVGLGQMFFMHNGEPLLRFQHRRVGEWPPEGGISTVCRSVSLAENADLLERSQHLLQRMGWEGAAMVEYRFDPATGEARLMEINGRFWGSLPLAYHAGAPFAWLTYKVEGLGENDILPPYKDGIVCRFMIPEIRRLLTLFFRRSAIQNKGFDARPWATLAAFLGDFLRPRTRYYVFKWADPKPFFADFGFMVLKALRIRG